MSARFPLGVVVATPGALDLLARWDLDDLLAAISAATGASWTATTDAPTSGR